jgi:hypothetical protein
MEAQKFYALQELLKEFNEYLGYNEKVVGTLILLEDEIGNYEFERLAKIRGCLPDFE